MEKGSKKEIMFEKMKEKKKEVKIVRRIVLAIVLILLVVVGIGGYSAYNYVTGGLAPYDDSNDEPIAVTIPIGSGIDTISQTLEDNNVIRDARIFKYYVKFKNESDFQAGDYTLTQSMTLDELIESLKSGRIYREPVFTMNIPEGLTLEQIADVIASRTNHSAEDFFNLVTSEEFVQLARQQYPDLLTDEILAENVRYALEGYLYPATYPFYEEAPSMETIAFTMLQGTQDNVQPYRQILTDQGKSVHWLLTFASLLEEEATAQTDRKTIASVFNNRLAIDMPLQTDPTVLYALGEHKDRVLYADLEVQDPYNTYINQGLPPGPISGAGKVSLEAAMDPSTSEYLYFLADPSGTNHFAVTYDEHLANIQEYLR
ncbi:endolytic transglycosylase MltG [Chryseomicrobium sp. FSL W7-1435]|uniref:endolytic transglycosylase MltG n=1 Tax=Chryseomicrobium sp. FSL W7-1435 TaxID=2921704 RepID=UPI003159DC8C